MASAIAHWKPRFTANGVAASDFEQITRDLQRWDELCSAWSRAAREHEDLGREALAAHRPLSAGAHLRQAAVLYHFAKFVFVEDLDQMRTAHMSAVRCLTDALSLEGRAEAITAPLQVVMGKRDRLIPWQHARRLADTTGGEVDLLLLEDGNHGCANVAYKHRYRSADWMAEQLVTR